MGNTLRKVQRIGQSIWYDNIRRGLIKSGELQSLIDLGVSGVTSNPTIFEKAIAGSTDYDQTLLELGTSDKTAQELFEDFAIEDIRAAADLLRPAYDRSGGDDGYASLEVSPTLAHDSQGTIAEAVRLSAALDRPNVMVKVPATPEGIPAIRTLIGKGINVNTVPPATLTAFVDHGKAVNTLEQGFEDAQGVIQALDGAGIKMNQVTGQLLAEGLKGFAESFAKLMDNIEDKKVRLLSRGHEHPGVSLGTYLPDVESALADLQRRQIISRIWSGDHTVWKPDPTEISNRLGWLTASDTMREQIPVLEALGRELRDAGVRHVVVLGMGGSSLGPEVLRQSFGSAPGYPELIVLDSTVPDWISAVANSIDPGRSLFIVSSKSGSTTEPNMFYAYFRDLVDGAVGKDGAGQHFIAVTDAGTSLEKTAKAQGFRRVFANPPDIGGRYSVLSYFGMVPAALAGMDLVKLLDRADCMREGCASCVPAHENPGVWLGAVMGVLALQGRDKLTLVSSLSIKSFGLWVEQLIAESTGKEGLGIVPVAGELLASPNHYGNDRLFIYMRLEGDDNRETDAALNALEAAGQPVVRLDLRDNYDLGAEFFRWEMGTAIAGAILNINPFDQPNVQAAKDMTESVLAAFQSKGNLPEIAATSPLSELLAGETEHNYLAIMAYVNQSQEFEQAVDRLRRKGMERHGIATTFGYGPRFLHSTGQLHKGGPASGLFLQLTADHQQDLAIPGQNLTFGTLSDAQSIGDLQALGAAQRRAARVHLGADPAAGLQTLIQELS